MNPTLHIHLVKQGRLVKRSSTLPNVIYASLTVAKLTWWHLWCCYTTFWITIMVVVSLYKIQTNVMQLKSKRQEGNKTTTANWPPAHITQNMLPVWPCELVKFCFACFPCRITSTYSGQNTWIHSYNLRQTLHGFSSDSNSTFTQHSQYLYRKDSKRKG